MKEQILDFISQYPVVLAALPLLLVFALVRRYRRFKRRTESVDNPQSQMMLIVGFVGAAILIFLWLSYF